MRTGYIYNNDENSGDYMRVYVIVKAATQLDIVNYFQREWAHESDMSLSHFPVGIWANQPETIDLTEEA